MCSELQLGTGFLRLGEKLRFAKYGSNNLIPPPPLFFFFSFFSFKSVRNIEVLWFRTGLFMARKTPKHSGLENCLGTVLPIVRAFSGKHAIRC